ERPTIEPTDRPRASKTGAPSPPDVSLDNLLGDASQTLPQGPGANLVQIPPRPLEITWPDTRKLKHCLGHQIGVRIQVAEDGAILHVAVDEEGHPPDCVAAALESARRIVFAPGKINGKPAKMWTQIRIDFKERN
ncbi:MAG: energy transducer TonB, partial [bacterium]